MCIRDRYCPAFKRFKSGFIISNSTKDAANAHNIPIKMFFIEFR